MVGARSAEPVWGLGPLADWLRSEPFSEAIDMEYLDRGAREGGWGALVAVILLALAIVVIGPLI